MQPSQGEGFPAGRVHETLLLFSLNRPFGSNLSKRAAGVVCLALRALENSMRYLACRSWPGPGHDLGVSVEFMLKLAE